MVLNVFGEDGVEGGDGSHVFEQQLILRNSLRRKRTANYVFAFHCSTE